MNSKTEQRGVERRAEGITSISNSLQSPPLPSKKSNRSRGFGVTQNSHLVFTSKIHPESKDDPQHKRHCCTYIHASKRIESNLLMDQS